MKRTLARLYWLASLDGLDSLRPPGFDVMLIIIAGLGGVLASIQPLSEPYSAARVVLDPTLFTVALFLALRGSSGLAHSIRSGVVEVYLSYPVSRWQAALALLLSRIIVPAATLLAAPLAVAGIVLYGVIARDPAGYLLVYAGYLVQALLYGTVFALMAVAAKSPGTASVASITFYFAYNVIWIISQALAGQVAWLERLSSSLYYNYVVYRVAIARGTGAPLEVPVLDATLVPLATLLAAAAFTVYIARRFEPT